MADLDRGVQIRCDTGLIIIRAWSLKIILTLMSVLFNLLVRRVSFIHLAFSTYFLRYKKLLATKTALVDAPCSKSVAVKEPVAKEKRLGMATTTELV